MKTQKQIWLIKISFFLILISSVIFRLDDFKKGFISGWKGDDIVRNPTFFEGLLVFVVFYFGLRILINLYLFINSIQKNEIFGETNIKRLNMMGKYCILLSFALYVFYFLKLNSTSNIEFMQNLKVVDFDFWLILFGLTLLTISFVFKKGIELQQEQDLTI